MKEKNTSHLAGEFLVAGELARRRYPVSITMGNAKSIDIYADTPEGPIKIDAKAGRAKGNWPVNEHSLRPDVFYIFVHLGTDTQIKNNDPPEYFIVTGNELKSQNLVDTWRTRTGIRYQALEDCKGKWDKLPAPK
ncbi:MAG: hypothetical protein HY895_12385 [Deltaproteobacteria bacterium]|nr:hypothetical protein [Deltaproteobacteria bacterium]